MSKMRLATTIGILGMAALLVVSLPVNRTRADHCHPGNSQTANTTVPSTDTRPPIRTGASSPDRRRTHVSIPSVENKIGEPKTPSLEQIYSRDFPLAILSIGEAVKAIESGDRQTELVELQKALNMLITVHKSLGTHVKPEFANNLRCPIMGSPIQPDKVDEHLTRDYKSQKIAFCCPGCPAEWDKLTDGQKQAKLPGVKS